MPNVSKTLILIFLLTFIPSSSFAFRPFRTEDAGTSPKGSFGVEIGNEFSTNDDGEENLTTLSLIYGLSESIEVEADFALLHINPNSTQDEFGISDTIIFSKLKLFGENGIIDEDFPLDTAIEPSISIPTGDEDKALGSGETELGLLLIAEKTVGELSGKANIGYFSVNTANLDKNFEDRFFYGFQVDFPFFTPRLRAGAEITGVIGPGSRKPVLLLCGLALQVNDRVALDTGIQFGLNDTGSSIKVIGGLSLSFN